MTIQYVKEIPNDMFIGFNSIGTGSFSDIFSATHVKTNTEVALKISFITNSDEINLMDQEIKINKTLNHPFICKFFTEFDTPHLRILSMELIDGVSALEYVNKRSGLTIPEARQFFTQLLISIEYLHNEAHITHRDLKLENIMIDSHDHIRLIDFGFSSRNLMMSTFCGSIPYCAPEILSGQKYSKESDIWSMGIILYSLIHGILPFQSNNITNLIDMILHANATFPDDFDIDLRDLITRMLIRDPKKRITLDEIKNHPFLRNERIFQIDYKRLFSPSQNKIINSEPDSIYQLKLYKHYTNIKINVNTISPILRKEGSKSLYTSSVHSRKKDLHEKVNLKTDDVNLSIESRKNYSESLNTLIQYAFIPNSKYFLQKYKTRRQLISMTNSFGHMINNNNINDSPNQPELNDNELETKNNQLSTRFRVQSSPHLERIQKNVIKSSTADRLSSLLQPTTKSQFSFKRFHPQLMSLNRKIEISSGLK